MARAELRGKVVAITGGARGIGAATAAAMRRAGAKVAIGDLDLDLATQTAASLGGDTTALALDVTDLPGFTRFLDEVEQRLGPIDVLINNAGIMPVNLLLDESPQTTARQLAINLHAVIHGTREAVRRMQPRGSGHIVNVSSALGKTGMPAVATYCGTKFGVLGFSDAVRHELKGTGVGISVVLPGMVRTELTAGLPESRLVKLLTPEDVANGIVAGARAGRFEIHVPRLNGWMERFMRPFGQRVGDRLITLVGADRMVLEASHAQERRAYEARAAASAPGAEIEEATR
ncbi:MAG: SDR family NAD(P)-dependent oxidoreductase [Micromonosporaceae bacterium]|nr:SDR family NAD(P)-dependent oxidoreductase [Micromonosporaceae bacterium]